MSIIGGDVESVSNSVPSSTAGSAPATPINRVKFLLSHGGKILPRPVDGNLKYVGGETRVICVLRTITFFELMKKITSMFDGEMILKYQLMPEDLDVLVTVKHDEDVRLMIEECDRHEYLGAPRLRAFLFPANQSVMLNHYGATDHQSLEQRYINSINGIVLHPSSPVHNNIFSISSACSSPKTPPDITTNATNAISGINPEFSTFHSKRSSLTRNHSSPSLCSLGVSNQQKPTVTASSNLNQNYQQQAPQPHHFHPHLHPSMYQQPHQSPKPPLKNHSHKAYGPEPFGRTKPTVPPDYYYRQQAGINRGGPHMYYQRGSPTYDEYYGNSRYERTDSPPSPGVMSSSSVRSAR
ncbi:Phox/Bem1p [Artemisia annua]|uniref:Phox/Bem1p n=1 Tax=Artemisia annua TaxID=35608 RepID=A0A2U1LBQ4_ARTAN|nr:Phox/Bem1p [Artemisia annua]PWA66052.1 Phox/Bem1p [Artemisia annua]